MKINKKIALILLFLSMAGIPVGVLARPIDPPPYEPRPTTPTLYDIWSPDYDGEIPISWSKASYAIQYELYRSSSQSGTYTLIATTTSRSYTDSRPSGTWWYKVRAKNSAGSSSFSNIESVQIILTSSVTINSPQNISYQVPMEGYYPATFGFENDDHWSHPKEWQVWEGGGGPPDCHVRIENKIDDDWDGVSDDYPAHRKVLRLADASNDDWLSLAKVWQQFDSGKSSGAVEFWFQTDWAAHKTYMLIRDGSSSYYQIWFEVDDGKVQYRNSANNGYINTGFTIENDRWYHFKVTFECGNGAYDGLAPDLFNVYIDGVKIINAAPFTGGGVNALDTLIFQTHGVDWWYSSFFDAVGYSWDPYYNVGDNLYEGFLLEFEPDDHNNMYYQLDGSPSIPLLGDKVISSPYFGVHYIEVYIDGIYSGRRWFTIEKPDPKILIGSSNRYFSHEDVARLGFTLFTENPWPFMMNDPKIDLSITETQVFNGNVDIIIFIDNQQIWSSNTNMDSTEIFNNINANLLKSDGTHQIVVQLSNGQGPNNIYYLEFIKVKNIYLDELLVTKIDNVYYTHTPGQIELFEVTKETPRQTDFDESVIAINSMHPGDVNTGKLSADEPVFRTSIVFNIDPDYEDSGFSFYEYFYLHSLGLKWRVLRPDGTYLSWNNGPYTCDFHPSQNAYDMIGITFDAMDILLMFIGTFGGVMDFPSWYDDILTGLDSVYGFLSLLIEDTSELPRLLEEPVGDDGYRAWWETGYTGINGQSPNPALTDFSLLICWAPLLYGETDGNYQIEITWSAVVYLKVVNTQGWGTTFSSYVTTLSNTHYINFELF